MLLSAAASRLNRHEKRKQFLLIFLIAKQLSHFDLEVALQILERQGLARKFFQHKDLRVFFVCCSMSFELYARPLHGQSSDKLGVQRKVRGHSGAVDFFRRLTARYLVAKA
jgi:hypothetical protein